MNARWMVILVLVAGMLAGCGARAVSTGTSQESPSPSSIATATTSPTPSVSPSPALTSSPARSPATSQSQSPTPNATTTDTPEPVPSGLHEKGIDSFRLVRADRSEIVLEVEVTNRGCSPERLAKMTWQRQDGNRVPVRAYYRDVDGIGTCALYSETHTLKLGGLGAGRFTITAPFSESKASDLVVEVR